MDSSLFAEGMTYYKDKLVQITWKSQRGFIYNTSNLEEIDNFHFSTTNNQGWGISWDRCKDELVVTDGSENLHFWDPETMAEKRRISVTRMDGSKAKEMNEIEFWRGRVLANIWFEDVLLVINPETGIVEKEYGNSLHLLIDCKLQNEYLALTCILHVSSSPIDFSQLWPKSARKKNRADVFNGISISEDPNILYVTG